MSNTFFIKVKVELIQYWKNVLKALLDLSKTFWMALLVSNICHGYNS